VQLRSNLLHSFVRLNGTPQQVYMAGRKEGVSFVLVSCVRAGDSLCTKSSKPRIQKHFFHFKALLHNFTSKNARYCLIGTWWLLPPREYLVCMTLARATRHVSLVLHDAQHNTLALRQWSDINQRRPPRSLTLQDSSHRHGLRT
jgi:hypothetical protein